MYVWKVQDDSCHDIVHRSVSDVNRAPAKPDCAKPTATTASLKEVSTPEEGVFFGPLIAGSCIDEGLRGRGGLVDGSV